MADRDVFVVGAGNSAGQAALHLARHARHVTLLVRRDNLRHSMSEYLIKEIEATPAISFRLETEVIDGHGGDRLDALTLRDKRTGDTEQIPADALFILIGGEPCTQPLAARSRPAQRNRIPGLGPTSTGNTPPRPGGRSTARRSRSRPPSLASSQPATPATDPSSGWPPRSATAVRIAHEYLAL